MIARAAMRGGAAARDLGPLRDASWGDLSLDRRPVPPSARDRVLRRRRRGPQARGGCWEMRRGQRPSLFSRQAGSAGRRAKESASATR